MDIAEVAGKIGFFVRLEPGFYAFLLARKRFNNQLRVLNYLC